MTGKLDDMLRFHQTALSLRGSRQQLIASNIANADTPNYKARDIDFTQALKGAMAKGAGSNASAPGALTQTSAQHMASNAGNSTVGPGGAPLKFRHIAQPNVDGNTVDMDVERNQFADNAIRYEASLTLINSQIRSLLTAINGG